MPRTCRVGTARRAATITAWIACFALVFSATACDWTMFRYAPDGTAATSESGPITPTPDVDTLTHRWSGKTSGYASGAAAMVGNLVYVGSNDGKLYAFDITTGTNCAQAPQTCSPLWTATTGAAINGSPTVANGVVYIGSQDGKLYAFDALGQTSCAGTPRVCTPLWTAVTGGPIQSSATISNGILYIGSDDDKLYAFDAVPPAPCPVGAGGIRVCTAKWAAATGNDVRSTPAVANDVVYVGSYDAKLYAFDATPNLATCSASPTLCPAMWRAPTGAAIYSSPAVTAAAVYVGSTDGKVYAFDPTGVTGCSGTPLSCAPLWFGNVGTSISASPAVADGQVFVGSLNGTLYSFAATPAAPCGPGGCTPAWQATTGSAITSSPSVGHGHVFVGSWDTNIYAFDTSSSGCTGSPKTCRPRWSAATGSAILGSPIVANGRVLVGSTDGVFRLWGPPIGDWQQFRGGPSHQGITTTETTITTANVSQLHPAWTGATGAPIFSSPAVVNGVAYVGSDDSKVYAFDATGAGPTCSGTPKTCTPFWTANPGGGAQLPVAGSPAVVDGIVHVGTSAFLNYGNVFAYDAAGVTNCSGTPKVCQPLWQAPMSSAVDNAAMVWNGVVYYGDGLGKVAAFDADGGPQCSGTPTVCPPLWTAQAGPGAHGSPTYYKGRVLVGSDDGNVYAFDAKGIEGCTGTPKVCQPLWVAQTGVSQTNRASWLSATPAVSVDGTLFVATLGGPAFAFDADGVTNCTGSPLVCTPLWTAAGTTGAYASPAILGERVFFTKAGKVLAYDKNGVDGCTTTPPSTMKTCSTLWESANVPGGSWWGSQYFSSPAVANGVLYIGALDGRVYAYGATGAQSCPATPKNCPPLWVSPVIGRVVPPPDPFGVEGLSSSPTIANGRLYIGSSDHNLWTFEL